MSTERLTVEQKLEKYKSDLSQAEYAVAALRADGYKVEVIVSKPEDPYKASVEYKIWRPV